LGPLLHERFSVSTMTSRTPICHNLPNVCRNSGIRFCSVGRSRTFMRFSKARAGLTPTRLFLLSIMPLADFARDSDSGICRTCGFSALAPRRNLGRCYSLVTLIISPTRIIPPRTTSARRPPRWINPRITPLTVSFSKCAHGSHSLVPRNTASPTAKSRSIK
jgi:hypothetical protein